MSSSIDAGYYAEQTKKEEKEPCKLSPTSRHEREVAYGTWPSVAYRCKHCKTLLGYSK
jgi:hypothetical protein